MATARIALKDTYLDVDVTNCLMSPMEMQAIFTDSISRAVESGRGIIIRREEPVKISVSAVSFSTFADIIWENGFRNRLALVLPEEMHDRNLDFFLAVAERKGIKIRLFSSVKHAALWIETGALQGTNTPGVPHTDA